MPPARTLLRDQERRAGQGLNLLPLGYETDGFTSVKWSKSDLLHV